MPTRLETFINQVRMAGVSVADLSSLLRQANGIFADLDTELQRVSGILDATTARQKKLAESLAVMKANPQNYPDYRITQREGQVAGLQPNIDKLTRERDALLTERKAVVNLTPETNMINAAKAIDSLIAKYELLQQTLSRMQNLGPAGAAGRATVERAISGTVKSIDLNMRQLIPYQQVIRATGGPEAAAQFNTNDTHLRQIEAKKRDLLAEQQMYQSWDYLGDPTIVQRLNAIAAAMDRLAAAERRLRQEQVGLNETTPHPEAGTPATTVLNRQELQRLQGAYYGMTPDQQQATLNADRLAAQQEMMGSLSNNNQRAQYQRQQQQLMLQYQREQTLGSSRYGAVMDMASQRGFTAKNVTSIKESGLEGIQRVNFLQPAAQSIDGVTHSLDLFVDKAGRVLPTSTRQFSTFASSVARDFRELGKWTIAISLIYGPMRKIQEIMGLMVTNEVALANASIAVSDSTLRMGEIFDIADAAANAMGEDVSQVITNFSEAYQATGGMGKAMERTATATTLMNDALILSKLSSLDATQSIDTLASALRQSASSFDDNVNPLTQGSLLLDQWVKVSKVANVDITTLATGFSVLGEAANAAGLSNEELNAILAVTSETMGVTGREAANMARSFVAGFQSDKAVAALESVGIATKTATGESRTLLQIQGDLYRSLQEQTISPDTFSKLTLAIGGGTRRQAPVAGFIQSFPRISQIVAAQEDVQGQAAAALAKQLDTVQTAMTKLQNSFQSLAQSLGDEGGLLDVFKVVLDLFTGIVTVADKAFASMGKAGPVLAIALGAGAYIKGQGADWIRNFAQGAGIRAMKLTGGFDASGVATPQGRRTFDFVENMFTGKGGLGPRIAGIAGSAMLASILPAIQNFSNAQSGQDRFGTAKGIADILGATGGAIASSFMGVSPLIGATVGQAIAEGFVNNATRDLSALKVEGGGLIVGGAPITETSTVQQRLGGGGIKQWWAQAFSDSINYFIGAVNPKNLPKAKNGESARFTSAERMLYQWLSPEEKKAYDEWYAGEIASGNVKPTTVSSPFETAQKAQQTQYGDYIKTQQKSREQEFLDQLIKGKITPTEYQAKTTTLSTFEERSTRFFAAFGEQFLTVSDDINTANDAYKAFLDIFTYGSEEQISQLSTMVTDISDLDNKIQALRERGGPAAQAQIPALEEEKARLQGVLAQSTSAMYQQTYYQKNPVPSMFNNGQAVQAPAGGDVMGVIKTWLQQAYQAQLNFLMSKGGGGYSRQQAVGYMTLNNEDISIPIEEGGQLVYKKLSQLAEELNIPMEGLVGGDWLQKIFDTLIAQGKVNVKVDVVQKGLTETGLPQSMEGLVRRWVDYFTAMFQNWGITDPEKPQVMIWEGGQWSEWKAGDKAQQMALSKVNETLTKQLEQGMWNIPEGATFWVPITSLTAANQPQGPGVSGGEPPAVTAGSGGLRTDTTTKRGPLSEGGFGPNYYYGEDYALRHPGATGFPGQNSFSKDSAAKFVSKELLSSLLGSIAEEKMTARGADLGWSMKDPWGNLGQAGQKSNWAASKNVSVVSRANINLTNTTTLVLDGRVLAIAMKKYLAKDMKDSQSTFGGESVVI